LKSIPDSKAEPNSSVRGLPLWLKAHSDAVCVLLIVAFSAILFFVNLGSAPLWASDEQTYSQWGFYMAKTGDYLNPWAFGAPSLWIGKPPLYFWLMALSYQVFGVSNFSTRFWSPIFGVLSCVTIFYMGKELYNRSVGLLSVVVLGTFFSFFTFARLAMLDVPLIFFMLGSVFFFVRCEKTGNSMRYALLGGLFFGLALMMKQTTALLIPLILAPYVVLSRWSLRPLFTRRFAVLLGIGFLVIAPWLIYMAVQYGGRFWYVYFLYNNVLRTLSPLEGHAGDFLFYFNYLFTKENLLWLVLLPFGVVLSAFNAIRKRSGSDTLLVVWVVVVLGVFTVAQTKLYWYILPVFPAFALVIGSFLYACIKWVKNRRA
jgi:4-amino-4-deoxy-L-arabinose transferase-like glycosyltransferase